MGKPEGVVVVFAKVPALGMAKSRIAATHGKQRALDIYQELLLETGNAVRTVPHHVAFTGADDPGPLKDVFVDAQSFFPQDGETLGHKLRNAFSYLFERGYGSLCAIGCDCPTMTGDDILSALGCLGHRSDVVVGPATDGGYYLVGCTQACLSIFSARGWGTSDLLDETLSIVRRHGYSCSLLRPKPDVDTMEDYKKWGGKTDD